jgi:hypothetical protein
MSQKQNFLNLTLSYLTPVLVGVGIVLNLLTIMVFSRVKMRKYCVSVSMICLAVSDTAILTISGFFFILFFFFRI